MGTVPGDQEFEEFVALSEGLKAQYIQDDTWEESPFGWIKKRPSRQRGKVAEQLVTRWAEANGFSVSPSPDSDADALLEGRRLEIKSSTIWQQGTYRFQQIRDQNYSILFCLGLSPCEIHAWAFPKELLMRLWREGQIRSQHGGEAGTDTAWLRIRPGDDVHPEWVAEWGGSLPEARQSLERLLSE